RTPPFSSRSDPDVTSENYSRPSYSSTDTRGLAVLASTSLAQQTTSKTSTEESQHASPATEIDCMIVDSDSSVGSPTFNIDSQEATGATHAFPEPRNGPSLELPAQRPPSTGVYQPHTTHAVKRERVMYFGPGTTAGSPTFNIRSPRASGTVEQVISHRSEVLTEFFS
ncbi:hypothetical protein DFH29DRAFT_177516, partial [Suillus ampliporus]